MTEQKRKLYLVDGTALMYRAYFAFINNPLINSKGENTSASYGVVNTLTSMIREFSPEYCSVAFDTRQPTFRHEMYDQYKATRQKMPDDLADQVHRVKEAVDALGFHQIEIEGFEADDIIGTLAVQGAENGFEVIMVTGDKDFMQLVRPGISMFIPMKNEIIDAKGVEEKFGVPPDRIIDFLALMGDSSDNVPGVPKVGKKTAAELIMEFGNLDSIIERTADISKPSVKKAIEENREQALLSRRLVTIKTDVPVGISLDELHWSGVNQERTREFFREMEFNVQIDSLQNDQVYQPCEVTIVTNETFDSFLADISGYGVIAVDTETTSTDAMRAELVGISMAAGKSAWYLPVGHKEGENLNRETAYPRLREFLGNTAINKVAHNAKYDAVVLRRAGLEPSPFTFDTMIAAYVLEPGERAYSLAKLADSRLNRRMQSITELIGSGKKQRSFAEVPVEAAACYSGDDSDVTLRLFEMYKPELEKHGLKELFDEVEMPLLHVLMDMEMRGVCLDMQFLRKMSKKLSGDMDNYKRRIFDAAGEEFNINSTKQLGELLFEKIGLKPIRKTKTGYSTDIDVLTKLAPLHELPNLVLEYRQLAKLKSTYVDALPAMVNPETGRVHTSYNQAVASTGRLSSSDPNLQNIPIRTETGREIRKAFVPPQGHVLLSADYSQIELRIMAHISGDPHLKEAFLQGDDVHTRTASVLFNTPKDAVTSEQRRQAKTINFGVMYGMGAYSLSEQLGIDRAEAKAFIDNYFATHTGVKAYIEQAIEEAERNGFVTTLLGRKRYLPDIGSGNRNVSEFAKRTAINTPIQGSAADLIKISMINLAKRLKEAGLGAAMVLQVHDELVLEVPEMELPMVTDVVKETMEGAMKLDVPLVVDIGTGANWLEAH